MVDSPQAPKLWEVVYKRALEANGQLLFPSRLSPEFLDKARKAQGSYVFANQYQNIIIPDDEKTFKPQWIRTVTVIPDVCNHYAFIDPAIGQKDHHDYTGVVVVSVDHQGTWYVKHAHRYRWTPTEIVSQMFVIAEKFQVKAIGLEIVAYQEALLYFLDQEMKKRDKYLPVYGVTRKMISKNTRILGLVPRFEWGGIFVFPGMTDFEDEYSSFPRGNHDDILDALASIDELISIPELKEKRHDGPLNPHHRDYERQFIANLSRNGGVSEDDPSEGSGEFS